MTAPKTAIEALALFADHPWPVDVITLFVDEFIIDAEIGYRGQPFVCSGTTARCFANRMIQFIGSMDRILASASGHQT